MSKEQPRTAIALYYDGEQAPRVTARGHGSVAEQIIALAREHQIPLEEDPQLTALLAQLDLGQAIPQELYLVIAEVLAFAYIVTGRFPKQWRPRPPKQPTALPAPKGRPST